MDRKDWGVRRPPASEGLKLNARIYRRKSGNGKQRHNH